SKYIEVGWGDDDGYRKPLTSGIAMKALMGDPQTVLFAEGFGQSIRRKYRDRKFTVLAVDLSDAGMTQLCDHIQQTYALDKNAQPIRLGDGWYRAPGHVFRVQHLQYLDRAGPAQGRLPDCRRALSYRLPIALTLS